MTRSDLETSWADYPGNFHKDGNVHSFADGHVIYRAFADLRTAEINTNDVLSPDNDDLKYYQSVYNTDGMVD